MHGETIKISPISCNLNLTKIQFAFALGQLVYFQFHCTVNQVAIPGERTSSNNNVSGNCNNGDNNLKSRRTPKRRPPIQVERRYHSGILFYNHGITVNLQS